MKNRRMLGGLAFLALLLVFPLLFSNPAVTSIAVFTLIAAGSATAWNIFSGYTGYISLGYAAFYGLGAYALAIFCELWHMPAGFGPFFLLPVVGLATGICAIPLGWVALKTRRFSFMVITIAIYALAAQLPNLMTGLSASMAEISLPIPLWSGDTFNLPFYYAALLVLLLALATSWWVRSSKYGLSLLAIRDDEERAWGLGVKAGPYKLSAFVLAAIFAGMTGAINAYFLGFIAPTSAFDRGFNIAIPLMAFLGGVGTLTGPILGALLATPFQQYITLQFGNQGLDLILYGFLFLVILRVLPQGIVPALQKLWSRRVSISEIGKMTADKLLQPALHNQPVAPVWNAAPVIPITPVPSVSRATPVTPAPSVPVATSVPPIPSAPPIPSIAAIAAMTPVVSVPTSRGKLTQGTFDERLVAITRGPLSHVRTQKMMDDDEDEHTQKRVAISAQDIRAAQIARSVIPTSSVPSTQTQKVRAPRLIGMSQRQQLALPISTHRSVTPSKNCPRCQQTLSVWGATYFCTNCGLTLAPGQRPQLTPKGG